MSVSNQEDHGGALPAPSPRLQLFYLSKGAAISTALCLAADLGIADFLADGPKGSTELAKVTFTHRGALYRVLRLLSSVDVFKEVEPDRFALAPLGECLRTDIPHSMRSWVRMAGLKIWLQTYAEALYSLRTGEPTFKRAVGAEFFEYFATHPDENKLFNEAMADFGRGSSAAIVQGYDFSGIHKIVDVGGSHGSLIIAILQAYPEMTGILFDLPYVAEGARKSISEAGLAHRCEAVEGDFFTSVPAGGDAYLLRWIIHDWDHEHAVTILRSCRSAMGERSRLLLVETVLSPGNDRHPGKVIDFDMLIALGGQERTKEEYAHLLDESGFRLNRVVPTASPMSVIEGMPR